MRHRHAIVALVVVGCGATARAPRPPTPPPAQATAQAGAPGIATDRGGVIEATVTDTESGELVSEVAVMVTSPALPEMKVVVTDEHGYCMIGDLPDGDYVVSAYYLNIAMQRHRIHIDRKTGARIPFTLKEGTKDEEHLQVQALASH